MVKYWIKWQILNYKQRSKYYFNIEQDFRDTNSSWWYDISIFSTIEIKIKILIHCKYRKHKFNWQVIINLILKTIYEQ